MLGMEDKAYSERLAKLKLPSLEYRRKRADVIQTYLCIYNSVLTCRQNIINSSESAPLNATKIAVKKVSDLDVCMFGPEFNFLMYKCCFLAFLRESARTATKSRTNLSTNKGKATRRLGRLAPNLAHVQIHMGMDIRQKQIAHRDTRGALGGF